MVVDAAKFNISMYQSDLKERITEATKSDLQYKELLAKLQQGKL
jgi:hypothetical protein